MVLSSLLRRVFAVLGATALILVGTGCPAHSGIEAAQDDAGTDAGDSGSGSPPAGMSALSFSLPTDEFTGSVAASSSTGLEINALFITDMRNPLDYRIVPVDSPDVSLNLAKDGIHILTFINIPGGIVDEASGRLELNGLGGAISHIGTIELVSADLGSIPLDDDSSDLIDLGPLEESEGAFESPLSETEVESGTGYTIDQLGVVSDFDGKNNRARNPDIDRNGVVDSLENMLWAFYQRIIFYASFDDFDFGSGTLTPSFSSLDRKMYLHFTNTALPTGATMQLNLPDTLIVTVDGTPTDRLPDAGGGSFLVVEPSGSVQSSPPYNGDFVVETDSVDYSLDGIVFSTGSDYHEGIYLPLIRINRNDDGTYGAVESRWVVVRNDTFQPFDRTTLISTNLLEQANIWFEITVPIARKSYFENPGDDQPFSAQILSETADTVRIGVQVDLFEHETADISEAQINDGNVEFHHANVHDLNGCYYQLHYYAPGEPQY